MQTGDLVLAKIKGRSVYGEVLAVSDGTVEFRPLCPAGGWRHAAAREIVAHWQRSGRRSRAGDDSAPAPREQLSLPGIFS